MIKPDELQFLQSGHRARLRKKFLGGHLEEYEILELLLTYAIPRRDVRMLARQLYSKYGSIHKLLSTPMETLMTNDGIKENTATFFKLIHKIMELKCKCILDSAPIFHDYGAVENYCRILMMGKPIEEFHVFYLDGQHRLILDDLHSSGTVDWAAVYVREIVKKALDLNARNIILLHNHPTSGLAFSEQDIEITYELELTLASVGIRLYDHLLMSGDVFYSARNLRLLDKRASK